MKVLHLLLKLHVLLRVGQLFELLKLVSELGVVIVQLLALKTDLESLQFFGRKFCCEGLGAELISEALLGC